MSCELSRDAANLLAYSNLMTHTARDYLREVQYRKPDRLNARALLHTRYGRGDWFEWLAHAIPFSGGGDVADVGCGAGAFWVNAPASIPNELRLHLFDLSPGMVETAKSAATKQGRWHVVQAEEADAGSLPLGDACIDTLLAIHMLYHLDDPLSGAKEFARVLRRNGTAAIVLNPAGTMAELSSLIDAALNRAPQNRAGPLSSDDAIPILRTTFDTVERVRFDDQLVVTDPVDLLSYLVSLPVAETDEAKCALASAVASEFRNSGNVFNITKAADLLLCRNN